MQIETAQKHQASYHGVSGIMGFVLQCICSPNPLHLFSYSCAIVTVVVMSLLQSAFLGIAIGSSVSRQLLLPNVIEYHSDGCSIACGSMVIIPNMFMQFQQGPSVMHAPLC